jgi:ribosomal protein S16
MKCEDGRWVNEEGKYQPQLEEKSKTERGFITLNVGALARGTARSFLTNSKFIGRDIEWTETKTFLASEFCIKGPKITLQTMMKEIRDWQKGIDLVQG